MSELGTETVVPPMVDRSAGCIGDAEEAMSGIPYDKVVEQLAAAIPELGERLERERHWWGATAPPPHIVIGDLLTPYVLECEALGQESKLLNALHFLERLAASDDVRVQELAAFSFLERLIESEPAHGRLRHRLPAALARLLTEVDEFHKLHDGDDSSQASEK